MGEGDCQKAPKWISFRRLGSHVTTATKVLTCVGRTVGRYRRPIRDTKRQVHLCGELPPERSLPWRFTKKAPVHAEAFLSFGSPQREPGGQGGHIR